MVATARSCTRSRRLRLLSQLFINKRTQMEYISHEDYKSFMSKFQAKTAKGLLKEDLEQEGNAFTAGLAKAKKGQEFKVDGKTVKDTSNYDAMEESGHGDEPYDFTKHAIESASGDKISHTEQDDYGRAIYWGTKNPNVTYYIGDDNDQIIKYDGETGERYPIGDLRQYDEPTHDYEPDTDADYEEPRDDFDMAGDDFNDGEFWEAEVKKLKEIAGIHSQEDGPEDDDDEAREAKAKKAEMDAEEAENAERDIDEEVHADGSHMRNVDTAAKVVAEKHGAELKPLYDKYKAAKKDPDHKVGNAAWKEYENAAISWCGHEMLEAGLKRTVVSNLLSGYGQYEDWTWEYMTALDKELGGVAESLNEFGGHGDAPDNTKLQAAAKYLVQNKDKFIKNYFTQQGINLLSSKSDKELYDYIVNNMHSDEVYDTVADMKSQMEENLNEEANYQDPAFLAKAIAKAHPELQKFALEDRKMFHRAAFKYAGELMRKGGESDNAVVNLINGFADEDWPSDFISALGKELEGVEEGLHTPPLQATGQTIMANEDQAPYGFSVLSPDERKQLKEYINSYKTIKSEISKLLEKAGKSGNIMENKKKADDEAVPAERPAHYNEPTKTPKHKSSNLGGDRTDLIMTQAEMWEGLEPESHERMESLISAKLHDAFHKVTGMIAQELLDDGFNEGDIKLFLQHEIEEKAKELANAQYDPH